MQLWAAADMTLAELIHAYRSDPHSTYHKTRYRTRLHYDDLCRYVVAGLGSRQLADIRGRDLHTWHQDNAQSRGVPMAHSMATMLRIVVNFGVTMLEEPECTRLSAILHKMRLPMGRARKERLTADHVVAIRAKAHEMGRPSIALAQAFQFAGTLRQKDCLGEYLPLSEPELSDVIRPAARRGHQPMKWVRGIRWEEIDADDVLRHTTSKRGKEVVIDLKTDPMVMEELAMLFERPTHGPVIRSELDGYPWTASEFRRWWRKIARSAGVPDSVWNMDTRSGAISEAIQAGAKIEHVRHAATHSDIQMTARYDRSSEEITRGVMAQRVEFRRNNGTNHA